MKFLMPSLVFLVAVSCSSKKIELKQRDYKAADQLHMNVDFIKDKKDSFHASLNAVSIKEDMAVIKKEEIVCGKGDVVGVVRKLINVSEPYLMISKAYKQFIVVCDNDSFATTQGNFFIKFTNIYSYKEGMPDKVVAKDVKVSFE